MSVEADAADTPNQMPGFGQPLDVVDALTGLVLHPARTFIYSWNWKAALLSAALRAPIFLLATLHRGLPAMSVEAVYRAAISGCTALSCKSCARLVRYVQMVPSVTVKDENQRTLCMQEGQT